MFDDAARLREVNAVADLFGKPHLVGDEHAGHSIAHQFADHVEHLADGFGVECRGHLVEQNQLGLHGQRSRDRHALLLSAREFAGVGLFLERQAHPIEQRAGGALRVDAADAGDLHGGDHQVLEHGEMREQVVLLEYKAHAFAQCDALGLGLELIDAGLAHLNLAALRLQQAGDAAQDGGLSRTGGPDDGHGLALGHLKVDAVEHLGVAKGEMHVLQFHQRWRCRRGGVQVARVRDKGVSSVHFVAPVRG